MTSINEINEMKNQSSQHILYINPSMIYISIILCSMIFAVLFLVVNHLLISKFNMKNHGQRFKIAQTYVAYRIISKNPLINNNIRLKF